MKNIPKIEFAPSDRVDDFAHKLIEELFDIKGALLTNESTLNDFDPLDNIPGHRLRRFLNVPKSERKYYLKKLPKFVKLDKYQVWYPPVKKSEWDEIAKLFRQEMLTLIEKVYGISMNYYPKNEPLYVWKVAEFVQRKLKQN